MNERMTDISNVDKIKVVDFKEPERIFANRGKDTVLFTTRMSKQYPKSILRV